MDVDDLKQLTPAQQRQQGMRTLRSLAIIVLFTVPAVITLHGQLRPHGNPLLYAMAVSWLLVMAIGWLGVAIAKRHSSWFRLRSWEQEGAIHDRVDVRAFRWLLLHSPLGWINPDLHILRGRKDHSRLMRELDKAEAVHWLHGLVCIVLSVGFILADHSAYAWWLLLFNIPFNVYPVMLQRWNRSRVTQAMRRQVDTGP